MDQQTFATMVNELGGPLPVARLIAEAAGFGNTGTLRVSISRKVNGHERIGPAWAALISIIRQKYVWIPKEKSHFLNPVHSDTRDPIRWKSKVKRKMVSLFEKEN